MRKHLKKGFTLVELLVVLLLMGLISTALVMALRPVTQIYADINYKTDEETGAITLFDFLNGDLRYATQVQVVSTDTDTMPSAGSFQNFIVLANTTRASSKKGARGYAQFGKTSNPSARGNCVQDASLAENDFQFSIESFNTMDREQSMTIKAEAHPMRQNSSGTGFEVNDKKPYTYKEAIQFVNMRYSNKLPSTVSIGFSAGGYNAAKPYTWILYTKPADISGGLSISPSYTGGFQPPNDATKGHKEVNYGATINTLTIVFQEGAIGSNYRLVGYADCVVKYDDGTSFPNGTEADSTYHDIIPEATINVNIPVGKSISVVYMNNAHIVFSEDHDTLEATGSHTVYIYNDGTGGSMIHTTPYEDPTAFSEPKYLRVHYIPTDDEPDDRGVQIMDADTVNKGVSCNYFDNGSERTTNIPEGAGGYLYLASKAEEMTFTLIYKKADTAVHMYTASSDGSIHPIADLGTFADSLIPMEGGVGDIYIYGNQLYSSDTDLPIPDRLNKKINVHFLYDDTVPDYSQADYCGVTFIDGDSIKKSSTTDRKSIPDGITDPNDGSLCRIVQTSSFDTEVTLIKYNAKVKLYSSNKNYGYKNVCMMTLDEHSPDEVWIYKGFAYDNKDDVPGYIPVNKYVTVHYLGGGDSSDGIVLTDLDNYSETATGKVGSDDEVLIPDGGKLAFGNSSESRDIDVTVCVKTDGTLVGVGCKAIGSDEMTGAVLVQLDQYAPDEIWIYKGRVYYTADEAVNKRTADENGTGATLNFDISWSGTTNKWSSYVWVGSIKIKNNDSVDSGKVKIIVKCNGEIDSSQGAISTGNELYSNFECSGDTITYYFNNIAAGEEIKLLRYQDMQIFSADTGKSDFGIVDVYVEAD